MFDFDIAFLTILLLPLLIPWAMKFFLHATITWKEMGVHILLVIVSVSTMYAISTYSMTSDYDIVVVGSAQKIFDTGEDQVLKLR